MNGIWIGIMLSLAACHKDGAAPPVVNPGGPGGDSTPVQYGVPYTGVPLPPDLVMYEVNFRAFSSTDNFQGVTARLDSIAALGVNVLYLMPVYPVGVLKSINSPYCIQNYEGVNPEFGSLADLRVLVDKAHSLHMTVLFDWVADHTSWDNVWIANKAWYLQDGNGNIISPPNTGWNDVAALNYNSQDMRKAMIRAMQYWVYTANIDGYRCDAADFVPVDFWQQAIDSLRNIPGHNLLLFAEGSRQNNFQAGFQLMYDMGYYYTVKSQVFASGRPVTVVDSLNSAELSGLPAGDRYVRYLTNHDVDLSDGTPLALYGGPAGSMAAFVMATCMDGVPMLYNGQEIGCPVQLSYFNSSTHINWAGGDFGLEQQYKSILSLFNNSQALRRGAVTSYSSPDVCAFAKTSGDSTVVVLANMRNSPVNFTLPTALANTTWTDALGGAVVNLGTQVALSPYQYMILKN